MAPRDVTPESEPRWQGWLARGRARRRRTRQRIRVSLLAIACGALVIAAFVLAF